MATKSSRHLSVNLPVKNVQASVEFFRNLGFTFNPQFSDDIKAACMIINEHTNVMLLAESFFKSFTTQEICDTSKATEALLTVSCESRVAVDELVKKALVVGGRHATDPQDHGFMYDWGFYDLDGHSWGVMWMDPNTLHAPQAAKESEEH